MSKKESILETTTFGLASVAMLFGIISLCVITVKYIYSSPASVPNIQPGPNTNCTCDCEYTPPTNPLPKHPEVTTYARY